MFSKIDSKVIEYFKGRYVAKPEMASCERILSFAVAIYLLCLSLTVEREEVEIFWLVFGLILFIPAFYYWRVFFILKKEDINPNETFFFTKTATTVRKSLFFISLIPFLFEQKIRQFNSIDMRYALRTDFYYAAVMEVIMSFFLAVIFIEMARVFFPAISTWSERKHYIAVLTATISVSILRIIALTMISGHGLI